MRIAIFTDSYLPFISGVTVAVKNQATELISRGHEVAVFCPRPWRRKRVESAASKATVEYLTFSLPVWWIDGLYVNFPTVLPTIRALK
ncbi:MAG: hypothetical protein ACR2NP_19330, partial [Pirellulaceae bacterium]